mmetsp:Transcript_4252/g.11076  ORF Transcript_4252/g.11076 Transcript_4252/m.11076 type:complete len:336 (-) Transcript_4252:1789-2796(-)
MPSSKTEWRAAHSVELRLLPTTTCGSGDWLSPSVVLRLERAVMPSGTPSDTLTMPSPSSAMSVRPMSLKRSSAVMVTADLTDERDNTTDGGPFRWLRTDVRWILFGGLSLVSRLSDGTMLMVFGSDGCDCWSSGGPKQWSSSAGGVVVCRLTSTIGRMNPSGSRIAADPSAMWPSMSLVSAAAGDSEDGKHCIFMQPSAAQPRTSAAVGGARAGVCIPSARSPGDGSSPSDGQGQFCWHRFLKFRTHVSLAEKPVMRSRMAISSALVLMSVGRTLSGSSWAAIHCRISSSILWCLGGLLRFLAGSTTVLPSRRCRRIPECHLWNVLGRIPLSCAN